jgi:hypothetical protein
MPSLFNALNALLGPSGTPNPILGRGSLISFQYTQSYAAKPNAIHDPYPLVIVTDIWPKHVRGVNLHYLTFPYIKMILQAGGGNTNYSYYQVKPDKYIADSFRMYHRMGMTQIKMMDVQFLLKVLGTVRTWDESEIEAMKQQIRLQIQQRTQMRANEMSQPQQQMAPPTQGIVPTVSTVPTVPSA